MRTVVSRLLLLAGLAVGLALAGPAHAQVKKAEPPPAGPEVHKMEIYNGSLRTVAYYNTGLSQGDSALLRDLERAENEISFTDHLLALRSQYAVDEQALQAHRRNLQMLLYGYNADLSSSAFAASGGGPGNGYLGPWGGGWGWGGGGYGSYNGWGGYASAGASTDITHTLAVGMGDEGVIKNELAKILASPVIPDLAARAEKSLAVASARVSESPGLAAALDKTAPGYGIQRAAEGPDVVTLKSGATVKGTIVSKNPDWLEVMVPTGAGTNRRYRMTSIRLDDVKGINLP
jgi:hypothetical protein